MPAGGFDRAVERVLTPARGGAARPAAPEGTGGFAGRTVRVPGNMVQAWPPADIKAALIEMRDERRAGGDPECSVAKLVIEALESFTRAHRRRSGR